MQISKYMYDTLVYNMKYGKWIQMHKCLEPAFFKIHLIHTPAVPLQPTRGPGPHFEFHWSGETACWLCEHFLQSLWSILWIWVILSVRKEGCPGFAHWLMIWLTSH